MQSSSRTAAHAPLSAVCRDAVPWRAALIAWAVSSAATAYAAPEQALTFYTDKALFTTAAPNLDTETFEKGRIGVDKLLFLR